MYNASICLLIKDEGEYLPEWLAWHVGQGFQHFYIYDDFSKGSAADYLGEYAHLCTVRDAHVFRYHLQFEAYMDCLRRFGGETRWLAFIDTDEFIRVADGTDINDFLSPFEDADGVLMGWAPYNANGHIYKGPEPVRERFTQVCELPEGTPCWKSIVRPERVTGMYAHSPFFRGREGVLVDENGTTRDGGGPDLPKERLVVDHYITRSYEEYLEKLSRGSCDPASGRELGLFETLNPGLLAQHGLELGDEVNTKEGGNT